MAKKMFESKLIGVGRVGRPSKRWISSLRKILRYMGVAVEQADGIVHERSAWRCFVRRRG